MGNWKTNPDWNDPAQINAGNEYQNKDGISTSDMNKIIEDIIYLKNLVSPLPQLDAPVISLSGSILTITAVTNATVYDIYSDDVLATSIDYLSYDLTQLQLVSGNHTIKVRARATGYRESSSSNIVTYTAQEGYTVSVTYNWDGGHADENHLYYSTDNGTTWTELQAGYSTFVAAQIKFKISLSGGYMYVTLNGTTILDKSWREHGSGDFYSDNYTLNTTATCEAYNNYPCFAENTKIKLANGEDKFVQDITYDDELLVWDFYEGKLAKAKPCWIKIEQTAHWYTRVTLDNGIIMRLVGPKGHRLFSIDKQQMLYSNEIVGHKVYTLKGIATVVSCERVEETVKFYNLSTEKYIDCFADEVLTGSRLNNMYHISNMKYDGSVRLISEEEEKERWARREALRK